MMTLNTALDFTVVIPRSIIQAVNFFWAQQKESRIFARNECCGAVKVP